MLRKGFKQLLAEANGAVEQVSVEEARKLRDAPDVVFVDARESQEYAKGHIPGAVHVPRGFLEFIADPESPMHKSELSAGKRILVYCASGGRSTLAAKTLKDMGIENVSNLVGGFGAWVQSGGPVEQEP
jgi:rhodanese-related sulfurtransferase